ncbi:MAG: redoxin domain-containing protein, partial [Pseudomonadota bacterium]
MKCHTIAILACLLTMTTTISAGADMSSQANAYRFSFDTASGERINFSDYAGKAVLVVNTASQCGFTEQYGPLQALYEQYKDRGLVVVAVPSNDFGGQEPGSNEEIVEFAKREFEPSRHVHVGVATEQNLITTPSLDSSPLD